MDGGAALERRYVAEGVDLGANDKGGVSEGVHPLPVLSFVVLIVADRFKRSSRGGNMHCS